MPNSAYFISDSLISGNICTSIKIIVPYIKWALEFLESIFKAY